MTADSIPVHWDEAEHDEVAKPGEACSGGADADAPAQESTQDILEETSMRPDDDEEEALEDDAVVEADGEDLAEDDAVVEADGEDLAEADAGRQEWVPPGQEEEDEEEGDGDECEEEEQEEDVGAHEMKDDWAEEPAGHCEREEGVAEVREEVEEELDQEAEELENEAEDEAEEEAEEEIEEEMEEEEMEEMEEEFLEEEEEEVELPEGDDEDAQPQQQVHEEPEQLTKQAEDSWSDQESWPLPQESEPRAGRQWGSSRRAVESGAVQDARVAADHDTEDTPLSRRAAGHPTQDPPPRRAANSAAESNPRRPGAKAGSRAAQHGGLAGARLAAQPSTRVSENGGSAGRGSKSIAHLEEENRQLRIELGQACYKVNSLTKLREQASESQRKELLARQNEARAIKELDLAKEYVGKKDAHFRNEKAELLQRIKYLEDSLSARKKEDGNMEAELAEATLYRQEAVSQVDGAKKMTEKWREDALDKDKKLKEMENRVKQMQDKRQQDKQRLRELASLYQAQQAGDPQQNSDYETSTSPVRPVQKTGKRANSRGPSQNSKRNSSNHGTDEIKPGLEDPIKPVKGVSIAIAADDSKLSCTGLQRQLTSLWRGTLRPLLLRESWSEELEGGSSGAPGRGKGKKGARAGAGSAALTPETAASSEEARKQMVLGTLVVVIVGLAVAKLTLA